ncbi:MAG TPA: hypothetical protein VFA26_23045, partial [Gemmataceae bacterium]|nr:hypothetical protein [Gemmataceae bacterium]
VLFGEDAWLKPPFSLSAGEFTVTAGRDDPQCTVCRFSPQHGVLRKQCPARLEDVLRTLADEGAGYPEAVEVLRQVRREECLTCRVEADALPQALSVQALAQAARDLKAGREPAGDVDPALLRPDEDVLNAGNDLGATPSLFETGLGRRLQSQSDQDEASLLRQRKKEDKKSAQRRPESGE